MVSERSPSCPVSPVKRRQSRTLRLMISSTRQTLVVVMNHDLPAGGLV